MKVDQYYICPVCYELGLWDDYCSSCGTKKERIHSVNDKKVNSAKPLITE